MWRGVFCLGSVKKTQHRLIGEEGRLTQRGFEARLILWMLVPPVLVGVIITGCVTFLLSKRRLSFVALIENTLPLVVRLLFLLYPLIAVSMPWLEPRTS